jgi:7,8-dihydropterin-6-yl-methyl-4-(beta-D-ribofuranosyl)aminobenzene 5'-phosphate synthase
MENTAAKGYAAEHGLSFLLESEDAVILFDTGQSGAFFDNALHMGRDLSAVTHIALSHGHYDHTGGLAKALEAIRAGKNETGLPPVYAHPGALAHRRRVTAEGTRDLGMPQKSRDALAGWPEVVFSKEPVRITDSIIFLGEIPHEQPEMCVFVGETEKDGAFAEDTLPDDSALAYITDGGLVIIAGCSHSGIVNIMEHSKKVTGVPKIRAVYGGLHCRDMTGPTLQKVRKVLEHEKLEQLYACHCTGNALAGFPGEIKLAAGERHVIIA